MAYEIHVLELGIDTLIEFHSDEISGSRTLQIPWNLTIEDIGMNR